jgi:hypothetical protein
MKTSIPLAALASAALAACFALATPACKSDEIPIPAASDPEGKDLVEGAVVAAVEKVGGVRLYKITHVDDYPDPIGYEYHMIAYDPKGATYEEAAHIWKAGKTKIALDHILVRQVNFLPRDHRVLRVEPLTDAERATYNKSRDSRLPSAAAGPAPSAQP